jgi:hypothetical protein
MIHIVRLDALESPKIVVSLTYATIWGPSNAAPEWQAGNLGWRCSELMAACPLEGLVRSAREKMHSRLARE